VVCLVTRWQGTIQLLHDVMHHPSVCRVPNEQQLLTDTMIPKHKLSSLCQLTVWVEQYGRKIWKSAIMVRINPLKPKLISVIFKDSVHHYNDQLVNAV
jgi:hypothetical protein